MNIQSNHAIIISCNFRATYRLLGAYRIASFLRNNLWDVEVLDYVKYWTTDELTEFLDSRITSNTRFIGFSTIWADWHSNAEFIHRYVKERYPHLLTIIGGQQPMLINSRPDYYIDGYGENALMSIIKYHFGNGDYIKKDPHWEEKGINVVRHHYYPSYPMPKLSVIYEDRDFIHQHEWLPIEFSRGCKFECKFCNFPILGVKSDYTRDSIDFEIQIKDAYDRFGVSKYYVCDETFNDSSNKIKKFATVVERLNFKPYFSGFIRPDLLVSRPEDKELLLSMGFFGHFYGIETLNHETGKIIGKGMNPDKLLNGIIEIKKYFKNYGPYRGDIALIIGLPQETKQSFWDGIKWMHDNWQGECLFASALVLTNDSEYLKTSVLSQNKTKYGYTESNVPFNAPHRYRSYDNKSTWMTQIFNWKNEHFTYSDAVRIQDELMNVSKNLNFGVSCWELGEYGETDLYKVLKLHQTHEKHIPYDRIKNYISNKLSFSKF